MKGFLLSGIMVACSAFCSFAQSQYVFTEKASINVRTAPSTTASTLGSLQKGVLVPLIDADWETGWNKINFEGKTGYVSQSVSDTCEAGVPKELLGKEIDSSQPLDDVRFQGSICITPLDKTHALISITWMRRNLPADTWCYIADLNPDDSIVATHALGWGWSDPSEGYKALMEKAEKMGSTIPVGYNEFNDTLYFEGGVFSLYE